MSKKNKEKGSSKKRIFIIIIVFLLLVILGVFAFIFYQKKSLKVVYEKKVTVNVFEEFTNTKPIKKITNGTLLTKKETLDTSKLGKKTITLKIRDYFKTTKTVSYVLEVVDLEAPVITFQPNVKIEEGTSIDLLNGVSAQDNSKEEIEVHLEGEYDTNQAGTYELYYIAKDSSGNETKEKFVLEVTKKVVVQPTNRSGYVAPDREFTTSNGHKGVVRNGLTYIDGILIANKTYALTSSYNPGGLTKETQSAFDEMQAAAANAGYSVHVISGFRSYSYQNTLYNRYVSQDGKAAADTYSARPGHSEHQTGLAFDLIRIDYNLGNTPEGKWLNDNAYQYGFILRYPEGKTGETGYVFEPWHFRYVGKSLAAKLYNGGNWITLESYFGITSQYNY